MADTFIQVATDGSGKKLDTRTEATNAEHRQVVVIGDPSTNAGVAAVDATNGVSVNVTNASLTVGTHAVTQSGTWTVQPGNTANTTAWKVDGSAVTQPASLAAETTKVIGTVRNLGNAGAIMDFAGQNAAAPANSLLVGAEFNTTPTTLTTGNASPLQLDSAGNLLVNIKAGAGSGGTALADEATFTEGSTSFTPIGGVFKTSHTALTTGQAGALALSAQRHAFVDFFDSAGNQITTTANALDVNVKSGGNSNGQALMSASAPVVIAKDQDRAIKADSLTTITSSTSETTVIAQTAATFHDVYGCIIENTSASSCKVSFRDTTGGSVRYEFTVPAGDTRGFMLPTSGSMKQATVNTNWTAQCGTSVASIVITMLYINN